MREVGGLLKNQTKRSYAERVRRKTHPRFRGSGGLTVRKICRLESRPPGREILESSKLVSPYKRTPPAGIKKCKGRKGKRDLNGRENPKDLHEGE